MAEEQRDSSTYLLQEEIRNLRVALEAEHQKSEEHYKDARTDKLTGLANHLAFEEELEVASQLTQQWHGTISLVYIDLDNLREPQKLPDKGHPWGDTFIKAAGKVLKDSVRKNGDKVYRIGGDEFVIIVYFPKPGDVTVVTNRVEENLAKATFSFKNATYPVTASIGVANYPENPIADLVRIADENMSKVKIDKKFRSMMTGGDYQI